MTCISENLKELIINGIKNVQDILKKEPKVAERSYILNGEIRLVEEEDIRVILIQLIENLASLLLPFFDDRMQDYYSENIVFLSGWHTEIRQACKDEHFKKVYDNAPDTTTKDSGIKSKLDIMLSLQIRMSKLLFNELNIFIQRNNLLRDGELKKEVKKHEQRDR
jgi:hypothetical protein